MQATPAPQSEAEPAAPRCPRCRRYDTIPMPPASLLDKLARQMHYTPFKCRACRAKFYRRSRQIPASPPPPVKRAPVRDVAGCHRDRADTLRRLDIIIRNAEVRRFRKG